MIMCTSDILCITNRKLCREDFLIQIEKIAAAHPAGIVLREKDLPEQEYRVLAEKVLAVCEKYGTLCILHTYWKAAAGLGCDRLHLPLFHLQNMSDEERRRFSVLGASCHSVEDAMLAEKLGCTYITAGHVYDTDCKKGLPGRGLGFLKEVCRSVSIPVYGIGGITSYNIKEVRKAGAKGACIMSGLMTCKGPEVYLRELKEIKNEIQ